MSAARTFRCAMVMPQHTGCAALVCAIRSCRHLPPHRAVYLPRGCTFGLPGGCRTYATPALRGFGYAVLVLVLRFCALPGLCLQRGCYRHPYLPPCRLPIRGYLCTAFCLHWFWFWFFAWFSSPVLVLDAYGWVNAVTAALRLHAPARAGSLDARLTRLSPHRLLDWRTIPTAASPTCSRHLPPAATSCNGYAAYLPPPTCHFLLPTSPTLPSAGCASADTTIALPRDAAPVPLRRFATARIPFPRAFLAGSYGCAACACACSYEHLALAAVRRCSAASYLRFSRATTWFGVTALLPSLDVDTIFAAARHHHCRATATASPL